MREGPLWVYFDYRGRLIGRDLHPGSIDLQGLFVLDDGVAVDGTHHFRAKGITEEEKAKLSILKSMGVKVHRYSASPDYESAYDKALRDVNRAT